MVSNLGTAVTVGLTKNSGTLSPTSLTIPVSGAASSTTTATLSEGNASYTSVLTATTGTPRTPISR